MDWAAIILDEPDPPPAAPAKVVPIRAEPEPADTLAERVESEPTPAPPGVPAEWVEGAHLLAAMPCPQSFDPRRWATLQADAMAFLGRWAATAHALGWSTLDVWGAHPRAPDARHDMKGLVLLIGGDEITAITADAARLHTFSGAVLTAYRRPVSGAVPVWELEG